MEKAQPCADFLQNFLCDLSLRRIELKPVEECKLARHVERAKLINVEPSDRYGKRFGRQPLPVTRGTRREIHKFVVVFVAGLRDARFNDI